jgi:hypothetical protein
VRSKGRRRKQARRRPPSPRKTRNRTSALLGRTLQQAQSDDRNNSPVSGRTIVCSIAYEMVYKCRAFPVVSAISSYKA